MAGEKEKYDGSMSMNSLTFYGIPVISIGITRPKGEGFEQILQKDTERNIYKKMVIRDKRLAGIILVNSVTQAGVYGELIRKKIDISSIKKGLLDSNFNFMKILPLVQDNMDSFIEKGFQDLLLSCGK
jgi:NAD(P)H-nitrite reductase large subunit